jgi:lipopolysaccharide/colanic/teichoic acid biosynthesis glycosyltransferase
LSSKKELFLLLLSDIIFVNLAWSIYYVIRVESGWIQFTNPPSFLLPMIFVFLYWVIVFYFFGLYTHWFVRSRFEEFVTIFRSVSLGCFILFFAIFLDDYFKDAKVVSRFLIIIYWILTIFWVSLGRVIIRGFQMRLLKKGYGLRNTVIIGTGSKAKEVKDMIFAFPKLGYGFSGFISISDNVKMEEDLGALNDLPEIVKKNNIKDVIIASEQKYEELIITTLNLCANLDVSVKIVPEVYEIVSGMVKSEQVHGIPLVEVKTELLPFTSKLIKRLFDIAFSCSMLVLTLPLSIIFILSLKISSKGKLFLIEEKLGREGRVFRNVKFNIPDNPFGKFFRKIWFNEMPQLINVLFNDMSIVGPEPETKEIFSELVKEIPYYNRRLRVKPGITGWAKIKQKFYNEEPDMKKTLQYDFYYIENMKLMLDFKIILNTLIIILSFKG